MGRAEAFAVKNPVKYTLVDSLLVVWDTSLVLVSIIRELLAFGTILNFQVMPDSFQNG